MGLSNKCEICGSTSFERGPSNRLSWYGKLPKCVDCGSLERHRIIRKVWNKLPLGIISNASALQFSADVATDPSIFKNLEVSIYGSNNSLDLEALNRAEASYDIIICNHVLEHIKDDVKAFSEMLRVLRPEGFLQLTVPSPCRLNITDDWGYPNESLHGHYRHYGIDMLEKFEQVLRNVNLVYVKSIDNVTGSEDLVFIWSKSKAIIDQISSSLEPYFEVNIK